MTGQQHSLGLHEDMHAHGAHKIDNGDQVKPALCCSILALGPQFGNIKGLNLSGNRSILILSTARLCELGSFNMPRTAASGKTYPIFYL